MAAIALENVCRVFAGAQPAVNGLSLQVEEGELLTLVGPSGCGKTTTLRLIAGLDRPTSGRILLGGRPAESLPPHRRSVALVFQDTVLYPHLNAAANLRFGATWAGGVASRLHRWGAMFSPGLRKKLQHARQALDERIRDLAEMLEITPLLNRRPYELSGGQAQRVALGRALLRQPRILLLDEPLSNADQQLRGGLRQFLKSWQRRTGSTVIHVTHDQSEALAMGDRIAVLREGTLQQLASPQQIYECPANRFVAEFIGALPMNWVHGVFRNAQGWQLHCPYGMVDVCKSANLAEVDGFLGVRPEHLRIESLDVADGSSFAAVVEECHAMGDATLVQARLMGGNSAQSVVWRARLPAGAVVGAGKAVKLGWNRQHAHFFDALAARISSPQ